MRKDEILEQLKKLDQNDTENKIQRALEAAIADESGDTVSSLDEADGRDEQSSTDTTGGESHGYESDGEVNDDKERDSNESIGNDSENNNETESSTSGDSINAAVHEVEERAVLDGGDIMHGCEATFDGKRKCVIAICNNCRDASGGERRRGAGGV